MSPDFLETARQRRVLVTIRNEAFLKNSMWNFFWNELKAQRNVDIQLSCEKKLIGAHKAVLFCASKSFESMVTSQAPQKPLIIFFHKESFINVVMALKYIYTGTVKLDESRISSFTCLIKSLELQDQMRIIKTVKEESMQPQPSLARRRRTPVKCPSGYFLSRANTPYQNSPTPPFFWSSDEEEEERLKIMSPVKISLNSKRRNDNSIHEPAPKRIRFDEYHCACCDFVCCSSVDLERHFNTNCPLGLSTRNNPTNPISSSDDEF